MDFSSCLEKQGRVKFLFNSCLCQEQKHLKIIELGRELPPFDDAWKTEDHRVRGCQSRLYLHAHYSEGKMWFQISADALISAGLGALLLAVYQGEPPETILSCPPLFLDELEIPQTLSPTRSNGLAHLLLQMKREALKYLSHPG